MSRTDTVALGKKIVDHVMFKVVSGDIDLAAVKYVDLVKLLQKVYDENFNGKRTVEEFAVFVGFMICHVGFIAESKGYNDNAN